LLRELALPAAWAAAVWVAVHPVNVESVAWIAELKNVLCLAFALPCFQYFVRWRRTGSPRDYRISLACHGAALAAKASVVALPLVLLAYLFWRGSRPGKREALAIAPFLLLSLVFGLLVMHFQHQRALGDWEIVMPGLLSRIGGAASAWWFYLGKVIWPLNLTTIYPRWGIDPPRVGQLLSGLVAVAGLVALWRFPSPAARATAFGLTAYTLLLAPALGLIKMSFMRHGLVADHFQHLALPALAATLVCGGASLTAARSLVWRRAACGLLCVSGLVCFGLSWQRAGLHANQEALWEDALIKNPQSPLPHANLGTIHAGRGEFPAAETHFREAIRLGPEDARTLTNLGLTFVDRGRPEEAVPWLRKAVALSDRFAYPPAHLNLARALVQANQQVEGLRVLAQAADRFPDNLLINSAAGASLVLAGKPAEALPCLERSERLEPRGAATKFYLAAALQALGRNREAAEKRAEAIRLDPSLNGAQLPTP
jgi:tetratricopeptide (TPR) repeat protein